jgi:transcriptional regulator with XRE-family HTH domain
MSGARRSAVSAEAVRRSREQRSRIGSEIRQSRQRRNWTQAALAERAGISRHVAGRIERGVTRLDVDVLQRIGVALNRYLEIRFGRDAMEQPADAGHLAMQELILRLGRANGFVGEFEVPTRPAEPWRSIDVVLGSRPRRLMILDECWNTFGDIGAAARATVRKTAELEALATGRWGEDARVRVVWIVRATARNRALLARYPEIFASRFPGSSRAWLRALTEGSEPPTEPGLVWCDVAATRLLEWRRRS